MGRKKRNGRRDLAIDLTSLLDVIFIILLVVLCAQKRDGAEMTVALEEQQSQAQSAKEDAENAKALYEDMLDTSENINKYIWAASIAVPYNKDKITEREIKVLVEGSEIESFDMIGNDTEDALALLRSSLVRYIDEHKDDPVILSLNDNDENILYRDEKAVSHVLLELSEEYPNVYVKGNLSEDLT